MWQMNRLSLRLLIAVLLIVPATTSAAFDYFASNRLLVRNGLQAVLMCNGLYTSHRALADVFDQELSYLVGERFGGIVGTVEGGDYLINADLKQVSVGGGRAGPRVSAVFRAGIGCVVMSPDQGPDDIDALPMRQVEKPSVDPRHHRLAVG